MTIPKCTSWLGHKFEARYSVVAGENTASIIEAIGHGTASTQVNVPFDRVYQHDVCTRCGHIVNNRTPKDPKQ